MQVKNLRIEWDKKEDKPIAVALQLELNRQVVEIWQKRLFDLLAEPAMESITMTFIPHLEAPPKITVSTEVKYNDQGS